MLKIALVIFREMLEISLILGIVFASTSSIKNSRVYIIAGMMGGFIGAAILAFFITTISSSMSGYGEEIIDVAIIMVTVIVVGTTAIWVKNSGYEINNKLKKLVNVEDDSQKPKVMLLLVVATTIFRESTEIVLYLHALASAYNVSTTDYIMGFILGTFAGVGAAIGVNYSMSKIGVKYLFKVSFILLALVAASLASEAAGILTSVGIVSFLSDTIWDSEDFISDFSLIGKILKILVGYNSKPNGLQIIFYLGTLLFVYIGSKLGKKQNVKIAG